MDSLAFVEVGIGFQDDVWWKKLCQALTYYELLVVADKQESTPPMLLAVLAVDDAAKPEKYLMGIFLCIPKVEDYRVCLLWHGSSDENKGYQKLSVSQALGKFLRAVEDFGNWRDKESNDFKYEYFSSNCCRVGDKVNAVVVA